MLRLKKSVTSFMLTTALVACPFVGMAFASDSDITKTNTLPDKQTILSLSVGKFPQADASTPQQSLSMSEALRQAWAKDLNVQLKQVAVDRAWDVRDDNSPQTQYLVNPNPVALTKIQETSEIQSFMSLLSSDLNWNDAKRDLSTERDSIAIQVAQNYAAVQRSLAKVQSAEAAYKYAQWQQKNVGLQMSLGVISKTNQVELTANTIGKQKALEAAQEALTDAYHKFNDLLGLNSDARPILPDLIVYQPMGDIEVDHYIGKVMAESPVIASTQSQLDLARSVRNVYSPGSGSTNVRGEDVQKGELSVALAKQTQELGVRQIASGITMAERQINGLVEALRVARQTESVAQLKYDVGLGTLGDNLSAKASRIDAEQKYFDAVWQHELLKLGLEKPWAWKG